MSGRTPDSTELNELELLRERNRQLQQALDSRIAIEQAKGVLAERLGLTVEEAFALLRYAARSARMRLHDLARSTAPGAPTPSPIALALTRTQRWRAAAQRELAEAQRERVARQRQRLADLSVRRREAGRADEPA